MVIEIELCFPGLRFALPQHKGLLLSIQLLQETLVAPGHRLHEYLIGAVDNHSLPALTIGGERRAYFSVQRKLIHHPDSIEGRLGSIISPDFGRLIVVVSGCPEEPGAIQKLHAEESIVEPAPLKQWPGLRRLDSAIEQEEGSHALQIRNHEQHAHDQQMEGIELYRHVIAHVEYEYIAHGSHADQRSQKSESRDQKQQASDSLNGSGKDGVSLGGAHESPKQAHGSGFAISAHQPGKNESGELELDDLVHAIADQGTGQHQPNADAQPLMQRLVMGALAVKHRPYYGRRHGHCQEAEGENPVVSGVAAAAGENRDRVA